MGTQLGTHSTLCAARPLYLCAILLIGLSANTVCGAETQSFSGKIHTVRQAFTVDPGGRKQGELFTNTRVNVIEERGDWAKVQVEGWVRKNAIVGTEQKVSIKDATALNTSGLTITTQQFRYEPNQGGSERMYVDLMLKNGSAKPIYSWRALLVGRNQKGEVILSETVTDDKANIQIGESKPAAFFWKPTEAAFEALKNAHDADSTIVFELSKVELVQE